MTFPPSAISAAMTAAAFCRVVSSLVLKICAVPRPTAGSNSPLFGIARVMRFAVSASAGGASIAVPNAAPASAVNSRRLG